MLKLPMTLRKYVGPKEFIKKVMWIAVSLISVAWMLAAYFFGSALMRFYIKDTAVITASVSYLSIVLFSYLPGALTMMFSFAYRSIQKTVVPMVVGIIAMLINVILNYGLIFGNFGLPQLGIQGAAIATLIANLTGFLIHLVYAYASKQSFVGKSNGQLLCGHADCQCLYVCDHGNQ